jgi:hypothetical protein
MRIRIQLKSFMRIRIQIRGGGEGVGQPKMCIPLGKILGTPLSVDILSSEGLASYCLIHITILIFVKNKKKIKESESQSR